MILYSAIVIHNPRVILRDSTLNCFTQCPYLGAPHQSPSCENTHPSWCPQARHALSDQCGFLFAGPKVKMYQPITLRFIISHHAPRFQEQEQRMPSRLCSPVSDHAAMMRGDSLKLCKLKILQRPKRKTRFPLRNAFKRESIITQHRLFSCPALFLCAAALEPSPRRGFVSGWTVFLRQAAPVRVQQTCHK